MEKVKVIEVCGNNKWVNLLHCLNNSVPQIFKIQCPDEPTAQKTAHCMQAIIWNHPTWFPMIVIRRETDVLVVKTLFAQKVVLRFE